ncbi:unnamed protein product [Amoebophrya sp. A25]|nr:unnamed protein product [Amoebophrya sp. A25]|eukprot:GSA25T00015958001.1
MDLPPSSRHSAEEVGLHCEMRTIEIDTDLIKMQNTIRSQRLLLEEWGAFVKTEEEKRRFALAQADFDQLCSRFAALEARERPEINPVEQGDGEDAKN